MTRIDRLRQLHLPGSEAAVERHLIQRMRHETRRRSLAVSRLEHLTPRMMRVHSPRPSWSISSAPRPTTI